LAGEGVGEDADAGHWGGEIERGGANAVMGLA
jgi:hypothetical protein